MSLSSEDREALEDFAGILCYECAQGKTPVYMGDGLFFHLGGRCKASIVREAQRRSLS